MQFDDFDKKIRDAAEHHHPSYDEKAWEKMEKLLNKHLPVEKDKRRRIIFFILLFLIAGSGIYLWKTGNGKANTDLTKVQSSIAKQTVTPVTTPVLKDEKAVSSDLNRNIKPNGNVVNKKVDINAPANPSPAQAQKAINSIDDNSIVLNSSGKITRQVEGNNHHTGATKANGLNQPAKKEISARPGQAILPDSKNRATAVIKKDEAANEDKSAEIKSAVPVINTPNSTVQKINDQPEINKVTAPEKKDIKNPGKQRQSFFAISFSAGPDLSFVEINETGKAKIRYGAGLSYTLNHFTLRSGFYVAQKIYTAGPDDYHPYYSNLEKVDANCKVYEIPVTVSYNFGQSKNHSWFASTGLSSYLMKRESYGFLYKDPVSGSTNYRSWTLNNKNKHYFSVLDLSAGYERKFSKTISLMVEPYLQIPFSGVGNGKIKLNSAGVLFTLNVKPFAGRK